MPGHSKGNENWCFGMSIHTARTAMTTTTQAHPRFMKRVFLRLGEEKAPPLRGALVWRKYRRGQPRRAGGPPPSGGGFPPPPLARSRRAGARSPPPGPPAPRPDPGPSGSLRGARPPAARVEGRGDRRDIATLRADTRHEEQAVGCERAQPLRLGRIRRADDEAAAVRREGRHALLDHVLVEGAPLYEEILEVARARVARPGEHEGVALLRKWRDRVHPDVRRDRRGIRVEPVEERLRVRGGRVGHIGAFRVDDHRDVIWYRLQRQPQDIHTR